MTFLTLRHSIHIANFRPLTWVTVSANPCRILLILTQNMLCENILVKNIYYYSVVESRNIVGLRVRQARKAAKPIITQKELVARLQVLGIMMDQSGLSKLQ